MRKSYNNSNNNDLTSIMKLDKESNVHRHTTTEKEHRSICESCMCYKLQVIKRAFTWVDKMEFIHWKCIK